MIDERKVRALVVRELALIAPMLTYIDELISIAPPCPWAEQAKKANELVRQRMREAPDALLAMGPFEDRKDVEIATHNVITPVVAALDDAMALCKPKADSA